MLKVALTISFMILFLSLFIGVIRLYKGPGTVNRIIIFDLFASVAIAAMAIAFIWLEDSMMLDIGLLISVVAFIGTIGFTRYVETGDSK